MMCCVLYGLVGIGGFVQVFGRGGEDFDIIFGYVDRVFELC